ncbi:uncharacterized protein LOC105235528 isoform X1 [Ailuropoda melanoleuca]|uniref:uncharacterized protein LOC105235528 isoform X1 n=1 Tax=Ailuropoda melanoleuca TaxID=9646 RepID=UPI0014948A59|nr:uncharacterized protein LOC105235528 isoform X1 [Ailuropoda melanoleuca]
MAKFLAELLGCTLPSKGASPMFESKSHSRVGLKSSTKQKTTIFSTLASEKSLSDCKKEQQWKLSMYGSITPVCFTSPLIEKPIGKVKASHVAKPNANERNTASHVTVSREVRQ